MAKETDSQTFGRTLADKRKQAGLSVAEAVRQSGLSKGTWSQYETGKASKLMPNTVMRMAEVLYWDASEALAAAGMTPEDHLIAAGGSAPVMRARLAEKMTHLSPELLRALETIVDALPGTQSMPPAGDRRPSAGTRRDVAPAKERNVSHP